MLTHENTVVNSIQCMRLRASLLGLMMSSSHRFQCSTYTLCNADHAHSGGEETRTFQCQGSLTWRSFAVLCKSTKPRAHLVPPVILGLAKSPVVDDYDLSSLKMIISAAALYSDLEKECSKDFRANQAGMGMSELSPLGTCVPDDALKPERGPLVPVAPTLRQELCLSLITIPQSFRRRGRELQPGTFSNHEGVP